MAKEKIPAAQSSFVARWNSSGDESRVTSFDLEATPLATQPSLYLATPVSSLEAAWYTANPPRRDPITAISRKPVFPSMQLRRATRNTGLQSIHARGNVIQHVPCVRSVVFWEIRERIGRHSLISNGSIYNFSLLGPFQFRFFVSRLENKYSRSSSS